jgi:hypothetical protein
MSAVNYRLELPTQWSIHPVFHIDLLTPYKETIMHGPNFTRPTPELIDGEEEYSVEKILDSRHFGRRRRLQYLVKWEGYPDAENMWVDKDDVFADDKVREFKASNPDAITHIRGASSAKSPHSPLSTHSQHLYQHTLSYMSSDGNNDLADEYTAGAIADSPIPLSQEFPIDTPVRVQVPIPIVDFTTLQPLSIAAPTFVPRPVTASSSSSDVTAMFRQLRVHTPAPLTPDGQRAAEQAAETFALSFTPAERRGDQASAGLEQGAALRSEVTLGATPTTPHRQRADSNGSATVSRFPLALSPKTKRTRSYTSCESTHVTSGVNTRQTPSNLTGIRTTEITAWRLDALSSRDRRGSGRRGLSRRSGRVDI